MAVFLTPLWVFSITSTNPLLCIFSQALVIHQLVLAMEPTPQQRSVHVTTSKQQQAPRLELKTAADRQRFFYVMSTVTL